jgi:serine/threonine protein kinase
MQAPNLGLVAQHACAPLKAKYIRRLGDGAFKSAHLVELSSVPYALKVATLGPNSQARIQRECEAQRGCAHPAIAKLHQAFAFPDEGSNYWVWIEEYLAGGTLQERRADGLLAHALVRSIGREMISALDHLRGRNLVHRDIKPANIIFRTESEAVLTDFGIVRALDLPTLTQHFMMQGPGTPAYAAPEQLNNDIALIDWRTDQFGLAVVLAECLLGRHPFATDGDIHGAIGRVSARAGLPAATEMALRELNFTGLIQALAPWPHNRFRTPQLFMNEIEGNGP